MSLGANRKEITDQAIAWCLDHHLAYTPFNVVTALESLQLLKNGKSDDASSSFDIDPRAQLVVITQYDTDGEKVAITNILPPAKKGEQDGKPE